MKTSNTIILTGTGCILSVLVLSLTMNKPRLSKQHSSNETVVTQHKVSEFTEIDISNAIRVHFTQSAQAALSIHADSAAQQAVSIRSIGQKLFITLNKDTGLDQPIQLEITAPRLTRIALREGASFRTADSLILDVLSVHAASGSDLFIRGLIDSLYVETSAGSVANAEGIAHKLTVRSISGSRFNADSLRVAHCVAEATSGAVQNLCVSHTFDVSSSANALVSYHGNPRIGSCQSTSGGQLLKK